VKNSFGRGITHHASRITAPTSYPHASVRAVGSAADNYTVEHSPAAESWWRAAAGLLGRGKLVTIDYGYTAEEQIHTVTAPAARLRLSSPPRQRRFAGEPWRTGLDRAR